MPPEVGDRVPAPSLTEQIGTVGASLREALMPIIEELAGSSPRPGLLCSRLGIDKSLASRLVRAVRCESDIEFLHRVPSPSGLRILLGRARRAGIVRSRIEAVEREVDRFHEFIVSTPGGKDAIDAHVAEASLEVRENREHVARQAAYKAMSFLLGYYCEALTTTLILVPAAGGKFVDGIELHQRIGMRRLRPHVPLALLSVLTPPEDPPREDSTWIEPIEGTSGPADSSRYILPEFSTCPIPRLEILDEGLHRTFVLEDLDQVPDKSLTIASAFRIRNGWPRYALDDVCRVSRGYILPTPCKRLVRDLFIAEDVYPGAVPQITFQLQNPAGRTSDRPEGLRARISQLDLHAPIEQLRPGPRGIAVQRVPQYREAVTSIFERLGLDPARFRGYRCSITYPVPLIEMSWWIEMRT